MGGIGRSRRLGLAAGLGLWAVVSGPGALGATPAAPVDTGLAGAKLGMTLAQWRALPFPGAAPANLERPCAPAPAPAPAPGDGGGGQVCSYATRYGATTLPQAFPLTRRFLARSPRYVFSGGALSEIDFRTSIDAFDDVVAMFDKRYGPAVRMVHGEARTAAGLERPTVTAVWRPSGATVEVTDPSPVPTLMEVRVATR